MGAADLGRYRLKRVLGRGAMGEVWEAHDTELGRRVAVKIMHTTDDELAVARTRFGREARIAALLRHPNIVVVHDAGEMAGTCFMVMELVEGKSLRSLINQPNVSLEDKVRWIRQIGDALAAMHDAGIVHRDVKPDNVIIRPNGEACLVDFGIAKWTRTEDAGTLEHGAVETADHIIVGTPDYLPAETRHAGVFDEKSDQYAWAVTAYELLAGVHPADVNGRSLADRADVPAGIVAAVERARSKLPHDRFASIDEALEKLVLEPKAVKPSKGPRTGPLEPPPPRAEPGTTIPFLIGLAAVLAVGAIGGLLLLPLPKTGSSTIADASAAPSVATIIATPPPTPSALIGDASGPTDDADASARPARANGPPLQGARFSLTFAPRLQELAEEDFFHRHQAAFAGCLSDVPSDCGHQTLTISCEIQSNGDLRQCNNGHWTARAGTDVVLLGSCEKIRNCLRRSLAPHVNKAYNIQPANGFELSIKLLEPGPHVLDAGPKRLSVVTTVNSSAFTKEEKAAFAAKNRAHYEECIARMPICAVHPWSLTCKLDSEGRRVEPCTANVINRTGPIVDFDCNPRVGACLASSTEGIGKADAGTRDLDVTLEFR